MRFFIILLPFLMIGLFIIHKKKKRYIVVRKKSTNTEEVTETRETKKTKKTDIEEEIVDISDEIIDIRVKSEDDSNLKENINKSNYLSEEEIQKIILLSWLFINPYYEAIEEYPKYFYEYYNINNPKELHKNLIYDGYLEKAQPIIAFEFFNIAELKNILNENSLNISGKKQILINRILENISFEKYQKYISNIYTLSIKGSELLDKYNYIPKLRERQININDFENKVQDLYNPITSTDIVPFEELLVRYYSEINSVDKNENSLGKLYLAKAEYKNKDYENAFYHYLESIYWEVSGHGSDNNSEKKYVSKSYINLPPHQFRYLEKLKKYYNDDKINECYNNNTLCFHYFNRDVFKELINKILDSKEYFDEKELLEIYDDKLNNPSDFGGKYEKINDEGLEVYSF
ncbi:SAP domain-containing protein [Fusobacterium sp. PH5-44]|uniref:SAP domain-containing protein n=1 Tax=unclassified Fusobacterium TaxID=2648384 RepID=UPI003D1D257D